MCTPYISAQTSAISSDSPPMYVIIAGAAGLVAVVIIASVVIACCRRKSQKNKKAETRNDVIRTGRYSFNMSFVLRKPVFGVSDQVRHKPVCTATEDG